MCLIQSVLFKGICSLLIALLPRMVFCQSKSDSSLITYNNAKDAYFRALGTELNLYNGVYYKGYRQHENDEGQPYFESDLWYEGSVFYDGIFYENIPMLYDLIEDELVIDHRYGAVKLKLIKEKVNFFIINGHRFVHLTPAVSNSSLTSGFYELLYEGKYKAYARWQKKRNEVTTTNEIQVRYEQKVQFYIFNGNEYLPVRAKSSVLRILKDKKPALQKFIRKQNLNFGAQCIESIPKILSFYESGSL